MTPPHDRIADPCIGPAGSCAPAASLSHRFNPVAPTSASSPESGNTPLRLHRLSIGLTLAILSIHVSAPFASAAAESSTAQKLLPASATNHWSFQPIAAKAPPTSTGNPLPTGNDLDRFIQAKLAEHELGLSPEADRTTLIRRLSFDLTGLPPSPGEIDAFVKDNSGRAYENLVDRLLASPRYGERWARHWLDIVRYTESQGFEYDKLRDNAWHYRDYVIRSFNDDKPYNLFMRQQVAGDVLQPVTSDGIIGASMLICGPWDEAGNAQANATQRMITREDELEDTIGVVGQTFLGLTINCARCHSHKFDPISLDEYYRIKSVFEGVKHGERPVAGAAETRARAAAVEDLHRQIAEARAELGRIEALGWQRAALTRTNSPGSQGPIPLAQWSFSTNESSILPGESKGGARLEDHRLVLPKEGAFYQTKPLTRDIREKTLEAWVSLADLQQGGGSAISLQNANGSNFDGIVFGERQPRKWTAGSDGFNRTRDLDAPEETSATAGQFVHVAIAYHADNRIAVYRNGVPYGKPYTPGSPLQTFKAGDANIVIGLRHTGGGRPWLTGQVQRAALYDRALSPEEIAASFRSSGLGIPPEEIAAHLTPQERDARDQVAKRIQSAQASLDALPPIPVSYVGTRVEPKPTQRLRRGDVKAPEEIVPPGTLSALKSMTSDFGLAPDAPEAQRRLKFADWLSDPRNPLPARVLVNRVWMFHFGQGLVATPNDFGASGARPTHPELLDWLASRFIEGGWSIKALHRWIVTSATYRQSSAPRAEALALDADGQWYWRYNPRRLEAEAVRDAMLAIGGEINLQMGGPSFRPFEILKFPANAYVPTDKTGPEYNRRTIYRMNVNSGKEPLMDAFDCPDPAVKTPRRGVTTTPLQALGLMNNAFVLRQSANLALASQRLAGTPDLAASIQAAYRLAIGRPAKPEELQRAVGSARERGLESVCWALLNSTEFVYVR